MTRIRGAEPVRYPLRPDAGFVPDPDEVLALIGPQTRVVVLNSPGNPTGAVLPRSVVRRIVEGAAERGVMVVSDEVYDEIIFEGEPAGALEFGDNVVSVFSFSKTYAMTGWRVGYLVMPAWLATLVGHVQEAIISCVSSVNQAAALAALTGPQDAVVAMRTAYRDRRDLALSLLAEAGITPPRPSGAFYLMVPLTEGVSSRDAALELVGRGVAFAPGSAFGSVASDQLRMSLASPPETIERGLSRFLSWYAESEGGLLLRRPLTTLTERDHPR
jgi:aspartate/methionine/tyrosine aminotransferase